MIIYIILFLISILIIIYYKSDNTEKNIEKFSQKDLLREINEINYISLNENNSPNLDTINSFSNNQGGLRVGCYGDDNIAHKLPYSGGANKMSFEDCMEIAKKRKHPLFGIQNGGNCWTGLDKNKAMEKDQLPNDKCTLPNEKYPDIQLGGGVLANDLYITDSLPNVRMCGNLPPGKLTNDYPIRGVTSKTRGKLSDESFLLKPELGANCKHNLLNRWVIYEFSGKSYNQSSANTMLSDIDYKSKVKSSQEFCPDIDYVEFNPSACIDPSNPVSCSNTPIDGYIPNQSLCKNEFYPSHNNFNNMSVFQIINSTLNFIWNIDKNTLRGANILEKNKDRIENFQLLSKDTTDLAKSIIEKLDDKQIIVINDPSDFLKYIYIALQKENIEFTRVKVMTFKNYNFFY